MAFDLTGINNYNEYYYTHYLDNIFSEDAKNKIDFWKSKETVEDDRTKVPWLKLKNCSGHFYEAIARAEKLDDPFEKMEIIQDLAEMYLDALGYPPRPASSVKIDSHLDAPVFREYKTQRGAPPVWVLVANSHATDIEIFEDQAFQLTKRSLGDSQAEGILTNIPNAELIGKSFDPFRDDNPPRWIILIGLNQIALIDRFKWNDKKFLIFNLEEIWKRREESTLQAMAVLLHYESTCPEAGFSLLDDFHENSYKNAFEVSTQLKYSLRKCVELLGNEVLYHRHHVLKIDCEKNPLDADELTLQCLRYMYRLLFILFIEARPELGYTPIKAEVYKKGYS
ncbi:MAG: class I SAM-dependent DNA methyltransferase, partial [Deltaproteobacteria bacterium]|nr:class I SAM-dependent DNA methyltransferase [Deltaproteobacteria bacterium]